jgi:hypothetical protein
MLMKKKKLNRLQKIDRYLYRNSYLYKWGKQLWRNRIGRVIILVVIGMLLVNTGYVYYKNHQVKRFLMNWQGYQNNHQYQEFVNCIDLTPENPDRLTFPDWQAQFFDSPLLLKFSDISVNRLESGYYRAEMVVRFQMNGRTENRFHGIVYVRENGSFRIMRVEI